MKKLGCVLLTLAAITATGICADGTVPQEENACAELPSPCKLYCQEAMSAESRALDLEKAADQANSAAEEAKNRAEYFENIIKQTTFEIQSPNKNKSRNGKSITKPLWIVADSLLRTLVPRHARNNNRSEIKPAQGQAPRYKITMQNGGKANAGDIIKKEGEAWLEAEKTKKTAAEANQAAKEARANAKAARRKYETFLCR